MLIRRLRPLRTIWLIPALGPVGLGAIGLAVVLAGGQACPFAALRASSGRSEQEGRRPVTADVDVAPQALVRTPPGADWPSYNGDYTGRRYTALDQINSANVHELRAQWVFHSTNSDSMEVTPVVVHGVMYITSGNDAFALDARTGRVLWHHTRALSEGLIDDAASHHNRGVAVWHTRVFMETDNAHLLCLDARSGNLVWDVEYADTKLNYGAT